MVAVVLVVLGEDGKGLLGCACVVAALGGLDGFTGLDGYKQISVYFGMDAERW